MAYLDDHPNPNLPQQRPRRDTPSGLIVVHTAESALDATGEDTGAEGVAAFISRRTDYGSYHRLADSDSVVDVARFEMTTYGDGTGSNDHAIHVSAACRAADWPTMVPERRDAFVLNLARAAADAARWLDETHGRTVPARRVNREQSDRRIAGFISHAERDPGRRTDPGPAFPWDDFLTTYADLMGDDDMANYAAQLDRIEKQNDAILKRLAAQGAIRTRLAKLVEQGRATKKELADLQRDLETLTDG